MLTIILAIFTAFFQHSVAQGTGKVYTGHGYFGNNCPIAACSTLAAACVNGKYLAGCRTTNTDQGTCTGCSNSLPANAAWTSNGGLSATGCTWACLANFDLSGNQCILKTCSSNSKPLITNSAFKPGTDANSGAYPYCNYQCLAGYIPVGSAADGRGPQTCDLCSAGTVAAVGASTCTNCPKGTYSASGAGECTACPPNTFSNTVGTANACSACTSWYCDTGKWRSNCGGSTEGECLGCNNDAFTVVPPT